MHISSKHHLLLSFAVLGASSLGVAPMAMAQDDGAVATTTGVADSTSDESSDSDSETFSDDETESSTSWNPTFPGTGIWSGGPGWPGSYGFVSCNLEGNNGSGIIYPGPGATYPFPDRFPGSFFGAGVSCSINGPMGNVFFNCTCGDEEYKSGQLVGTWFQDRNSPELLQQGCDAVLRQQCGDVRLTAQTVCANDFGRCSARMINRVDNSPYAQLEIDCACLDEGGWSSRERQNSSASVTALQLHERCSMEVERCGRAPVGRGGDGMLGLQAPERLSVGCRSAFGNCRLDKKQSAPDSMDCGCVSGEAKSINGDLGWANARPAELLNLCAQEIEACRPEGDAAMFPSAETGGDHSDSATSTSTQGGAPGLAQGEEELNLRCAMGSDSGRFGYAVFAGLMLLGWRRRRS